jgi:6-pyruvoyltetrahydropterin/6-carboxytetrahydropterin synthase
MKVSNIRQSDFEQVYELFKSSQVRKKDLSKSVVPSRGFYEYDLSERNLAERLKNDYSFCLKDNHDKIISYMISYKISSLSNEAMKCGNHNDPVLQKLKNQDMIYVDQLFIRPELPVFIAGRLFDYWDYVMQNENVRKVAGAIPQKPWKNESSMRFVLCRGLKRTDSIKGNNMELGLFEKSYLKDEALHNDKMMVTKTFGFEAAHKLENYNGKCANLHGHSYSLHVSVKGNVDSNGFVMDFCDLKAIVDKKVISKLDHSYLNEIINQPTAENIAKWSWNQLKDIPGLHEIKLWETEKSYVTYNGKDGQKV